MARIRLTIGAGGASLVAGRRAQLEQAADLYGVAPGTMARILVRRGARAVLDHHRRYDLEQDLPD